MLPEVGPLRWVITGLLLLETEESAGSGESVLPVFILSGCFWPEATSRLVCGRMTASDP